MKVAVIGNPRSGTKYTAGLFQSVGWDVGHEEIRPDGISCWSWAVRKATPYWQVPLWTEQPDHVVHIVREPLRCICSMAHVAASLDEYRMPYVFVPYRAQYWERAVFLYLGWNLLCKAQGPTMTVKTENIEKAVETITGSAPDLSHEAIDRHHYTHPVLNEPELLRELTPVGVDAYEQGKKLWKAAA